MLLLKFLIFCINCLEKSHFASIGTILIYNILKSHLNMMIVTSVNMVMVDDDGWNVALCKSRASVWSMKREVKAAALHETS